MATRHKPTKTVVVPRAEQLRRAKRAQRVRERAAGLVHVQLTLPGAIARKVTAARGSAQFMPALDALLDRLLIRVADYAQLRDLVWNRNDEFIPAGEVFALYERNWRRIDVDRLDAHERALIDRLTAEFGNGVING